MAKIRTVGKTPISLNDTMNLSQSAIMSRLNCHNIGKIIEFDKNTQTCTVQLMQLKQFGNNTYTPAPLTQVPLIIYGQGSGYITLPDPVGSICIVMFLDRNIDSFMQTGEMYTPDTTRMHDFSDCVALTTFTTLANPISSYDDTAITIQYQKLVEDVLYTAVIKNYGTNIKLQVSTDENTSYFKVANKFKMTNTARDLATLIEELITATKGIVVSTSTGALTTASKTALTTVSDHFKELLE